MAERDQDRQDRAAAGSAMLVAVFMIAQQVAGKATRDGFFLSIYDATALPNVMIASAVLSVLVVLTMGRLLLRFGPSQVVPAMFALSGILYGAEWLLAGPHPRLAAIIVYLHTAALGAAVISAFWSVINERFDPHAAKLIVARIAGWATFGGVIGGVAAWQLSARLSVPVMLLVLAGLNLISAAASSRIGGSDGPVPKPQDGRSQSPLAVFGDVPYLRQLAFLVLLVAMAEAAIDYVFKASADGAFADGADLVSFFALFYMSAGILTFILQFTLTGGVLERVGLAGTVALLPFVVLAGSVAALVFPMLWSVVGLRGAQVVTENSVYRSGYELLYTPLTAAKKRPTKTLIDVGFERLGQAMGSGIVLLVVFVAPAGARIALIVVAIVCALIAMAVTSFLHRGYVEALADSLRSGFLDMDGHRPRDRTTRRTISDTTTALSRDQLMKEIDALRRARGEPYEGPLSSSASDLVIEPEVDDPIAAAVLDLRSGDPRRIKARLRSGQIDRSLVGSVIPLLADDRVLAQTVAALRSVASEASGQLLDALLDARTDPIIRRRLPRILREVVTQRTVDGLLAAATEDDNFAVRYRCGIALTVMLRDNPELEVDAEQVFAAVRREARLGDNTPSLTDDEPYEDHGASGFDASEVADRRLEHMFTILALVLDREPLRLAYRAITVADRKLRGTGLEYLENVLPESIRGVIWPYLGEAAAAVRPARTREQIERELLTSMDEVGIDLRALRASLSALKNSDPDA